jgi:ribonuclease BN (tRNA processing enzyme)
VFLSHTHADHVSGVFSLASIRSMKRMERLKVFCPLDRVEALTEAVDAVARLYGKGCDVDIRGLRHGDDVKVWKDLKVKAFETRHDEKQGSLGYVLYRKVKKRIPPYDVLDDESYFIEIKRWCDEHHQSPLDVFFALEWIPVMAYTGDCIWESIARYEEFFIAETLFLECTGLDARAGTIASMESFGHMHLDTIVMNTHVFQNERVVLSHISDRYSREQIEDIVQTRLEGTPLQDRCSYVLCGHRYR